MFESDPLFIPGPGFWDLFQRVLGGDRFRVAEGIEWSKRAGLESRPTLTACSAQGWYSFRAGPMCVEWTLFQADPREPNEA